MTDDRAVAAEIDRLKEPVRVRIEHDAKFAQYLAANQIQRWHDERPTPHFDRLSETLVTLLHQHPTFGSAPSRFFGGKQLMPHPYHQAFNLVKVALERGSVGAVAWLHKVVTTTIADIRIVAEIHGVKTTAHHRLANGVELMPIEYLPASPYATAVVAQYQFSPGSLRPFHPSVPIGAVRIVTAVQGRDHHDIAFKDKLILAGTEAISQVIRGLTLGDGVAPARGISWMEFVDPDLAASEFGLIWRGADPEALLGIALPIEIDTETLEWVHRYIQVGASLRDRCDIALERLSLARRRTSPGNKAIEGAICLEASLGDKNTEALSYRLRLRAALLLGSNLIERRSISDTLREFYSLRSGAVHAGKINPQSVQKNLACADKGLDICARVLRKIIEMNRTFVPSDWEFSGGDPDRQTGDS